MRSKGPTAASARARGSRPLQEAEADYPTRAPPVALASSEGVAALERPSVVLPSKKQEPWRFTRLDDLWRCAPTRELADAAPLAPSDLEPWLPADDDEPVAVLVDGVVDAALSKNLGFSSDRKSWVGSIRDAPPDVLKVMGPLHASLPEVVKEESIPQRVSLGGGACAASTPRARRRRRRLGRGRRGRPGGGRRRRVRTRRTASSPKPRACARTSCTRDGEPRARSTRGP